MIPKFTPKPEREFSIREKQVVHHFWENQHIAAEKPSTIRENVAFEENVKLLEKVRSEDFKEDFRAYFEYLAYDQMSKFRDMHINYAKGFHEKLQRVFNYDEEIKL